MIEQNVQVIRCQDDRLWVRLGSQSGCTACDNGNGCGAGVFARLLRRKPVVLELKRNDLSVKAGQMLTLAFPEQVYLKLVFASYGWPLLAALAGAFAGNSFGLSLQLGSAAVDVLTLFAALLAGGFVMLRIRTKTNTDTFLNALDTAIYFPSVTPNMCTSSRKNFKAD